jgi:hypothetical protein
VSSSPSLAFEYVQVGRRYSVLAKVVQAKSTAVVVVPGQGLGMHRSVHIAVAAFVGWEEAVEVGVLAETAAKG